MRFLGCFVIGLSLLASAVAQESVPDYRNPTLPLEQRVADLLKRMTLEEKVNELTGGRRYAFLDTTGQFTADRAAEVFRQLYRVDSRVSPHDAAVLRNAAQRFLVEKTRLGIPAIFSGEALHGFMAYRSTSFPQALALASTWDPELVRQVYAAAADEMDSSGVNQAFTPVLDLARDPRWGRTEETFGEDPFLVSRMGVAAIQGLQGTSFLIDRHHVLATAKHFAVHGQPEGGRNTAPGNYSERVIRESFLVPFQAAVQEAHVGSIMASYNEIDGIPSHVNHWLLEKVLRQEWDFRGYVTSDGGGLMRRRRPKRLLRQVWISICPMVRSIARWSIRCVKGGFRKGKWTGLWRGSLRPSFVLDCSRIRMSIPTMPSELRTARNIRSSR